jgi:hypothetical protein
MARSMTTQNCPAVVNALAITTEVQNYPKKTWLIELQSFLNSAPKNQYIQTTPLIMITINPIDVNENTKL